MKKGGGWVQVESYDAAFSRFNKERGFNDYWQPCKVCKPEQDEDINPYH